MATEALGKYEGAGQVFFEGDLLAECQRVRVSVQSNDSEVTTMHKGLAGFSDGPESATVDMDTAIPKAGYEVDFWELVRLKKNVIVIVVDGGKRRVISCRASTFDTSKSDSAASTGAVQFRGKPLGDL